ncbi:MAG: hypothetical protein AMJ61_01970 [Desulfobacterales bacterium SG8_35_2]|nr:MAG: hypothetical protein AMJ61_01970 [Desulfobacterales bacterium SG8_35_2]
MKKLIILLAVLFSGVWSGSAADAAIIVGRISHVEGEVFRYMDVDDSWVQTHQQSPVGIEDVLATGDNSRVEITFPNNLLLRLDAGTEVEILELDDELGVFQLNYGLVRLYNRSTSGRHAIETMRGRVGIAPGSVIDVLADGSAVAVASLQGEATFLAIQNGTERIDVISGATRLEFREESVVAGTGPLSRDWNRWCADREGVWTQNRLVRSEYLPASMQEYAYELEPYGSWRRIYYRGYYYWAWKPHHVASGWSPYTNGYWYDWQGSPVWVDHNPWGWATHHHGHWIDMHGSWMWTPYIHVSHVPGVTVIGVNITFGKTYRPAWHPGRVRWITYNDYIGWFPLAPWETYYGYRRWDSRTVLVRGGSSFRLSINLGNHRHVKHGLVIPRQHLYKKGPVVVTNYNTVRIRNINKTVIVKNYKPLLTAEKERARKSAVAQSAGVRQFGRTRVAERSERKIAKARETGERQRQTKREVRVTQPQRDVQKKATFQNTWRRGSIQTIAKGHDNVVEKKRNNSSVEEIMKKARKPAQRTSEPQILKQQKSVPKNRLAASVASQRTGTVSNTRNRIKDEEFRKAEAKIRSRSKVVAERETVARKEESVKRRSVRNEGRQSPRKVAVNESQAKKTALNINRKDAENEKRREYKTDQYTSNNENSHRQRNESRTRKRNSQKSGREWISASMNNLRLR